MRAHLAALFLVVAAVPAHADSVHVGLATVGGGGATDTYRTAVSAKVRRTYLSGIKRCYRAALKKQPDLKGKLALSLTVNKRGAAALQPIAFDPSFDACVLKAGKAWRFGVPKDATKATVEATFTFELTMFRSEDEFVAATVLMLEGEPGQFGEMAPRRPGADLAQQIADVKEGGKNVKVGGAAGAGGRADRPTVPSGPSGRISIANKQTFDESTLTLDTVVRKIQAAYFAGLKRCYKTGLAIDATLRGKVMLDFVVNDSGRAIGVKARGFDKEIDACMTGMMKNWIFPIPRDSDGDATEAGFSISLVLVPE